MDDTRPAGEICAAEVVLPCPELDETLAFFTGRLGFCLATVFPADAPAVAVIVGHGLRVRLDRRATGCPGTLRLLCRDPARLADGAMELVAPNGTRVELAAWSPPIQLPAPRPSFVLTRLAEGRWSSGRAGMLYRDLVPDRQGGRFIASHIRIPAGGPVPDYVHYHRVVFQLIYCAAGSVRVVYEDQGPPFELRPGDAVLQPPGIRHRVLECSPGLEVIEISCPAEHETHADLELRLPTAHLRPDRDFGGQRFVRHEAARAAFVPWPNPGFEARDLGVAAATGGLLSAHVVRPSGTSRAASREEALQVHADGLLFGFVLSGAAVLHRDTGDLLDIGAGDAFTVPAGLAHALRKPTADLEWLEVRVSVT
jgi:mannose-6-phosphate isomerase-like protein (cupin superfamily)